MAFWVFSLCVLDLTVKNNDLGRVCVCHMLPIPVCTRGTFQSFSELSSKPTSWCSVWCIPWASLAPLLSQPGMCGELHLVLSFFFFFFFGCIFGIWKFPRGQGSGSEPQLQPIPQLQQCWIFSPLCTHTIEETMPDP